MDSLVRTAFKEEYLPKWRKLRARFMRYKVIINQKLDEAKNETFADSPKFTKKKSNNGKAIRKKIKSLMITELPLE